MHAYSELLNEETFAVAAEKTMQSAPAPPPTRGADSGPAILLLGVQIFLFALLLSPNLVDEVLENILLFLPGLRHTVLLTHQLGIGLGALLVFFSRRLGKTRAAYFVFYRVPAIGGSLILLCMVLMLLVTTEMMFWQMQRLYPLPTVTSYVESTRSRGFYLDDPLLGTRAQAFGTCTHRAILKPDDIDLFTAIYNTDGHGNRIVPQEEGPKDMHLAAFGCSFMFGVGANDDETLPAQLACRHPEVAVYCFAQGGYGPGHPALQMESGACDVIQERPGAAVYLFMPDHLYRLLPRPEYARSWMKNHPAFQLDADGEPVYLGSLSGAFAEQLKQYALWSRENFIRWSGLTFPLMLRQADFELGAALIAQARSEYQLRFPGNAFYVLLDPVTHERFDDKRFIAALQRRGLKILDPEGLYGPHPWSNMRYPADCHPTPVAHAMLADWFWAQFPDGLLAGPAKAR